MKEELEQLRAQLKNLEGENSDSNIAVSGFNNSGGEA